MNEFDTATNATKFDAWTVGNDNGETSLTHEPCDMIVAWFDGGTIGELIRWVYTECGAHECDEDPEPKKECVEIGCPETRTVTMRIEPKEETPEEIGLHVAEVAEAIGAAISESMKPVVKALLRDIGDR
jgi:hypothetical protein